MNENEDQSPFGRGFIAACIVIGAVLLCGAVLLITGLTSSPTDASAGTTPGQPAQTSSGAKSAGPGSTGILATPAAESGRGQPATPAAESRPGSTGQQAGSGCALPAGDQTIPSKSPSVDGWDVSRRVVVPRSTTIGPAKTDPDGFRHCFAQSPPAPSSRPTTSSPRSPISSRSSPPPGS